MRIFFRSIESLLFSLLLCLAVGCSETGSGGSDNGGNDVPSIVEGSYTMKYNGTIIDTFTAIGEFHLKYGGILQETADYSINPASKTITLTKSGYDKINGTGGDDPVESSYTMKYGSTIIDTFTAIESFYSKYGETLQETFDYTINETSKTITLTKSGYDKINGTSGDDPVEGSYTMKYNGTIIETFTGIENFYSKYGETLQETVDYSINAASKIITLTKSGYDKITGGDDPVEGSYTMKYDGETIETFTRIDEFHSKYDGTLQETSDYTIDTASKTITLTKSGYDKINGTSGDDPVEGSYTMKYDGETIETFAAIDEFHSKYDETLQETVDYTINTVSKTITLTKSGYDKIKGGDDFISKKDMIYDEETGWYTNPAQTLRYNQKMEIETDWNKDGVWETLLGTPMSFSVNNKFEFDNFEASIDVGSSSDADFIVTAKPLVEGDNKISICFTIKNISKYKWTGTNFEITTAFNKSSISSTDTGRRVSVANKSKYTVDYFYDNLVFGGGNSSSIIGSVSKYDYYLKLNLEDVRPNNTVTCKVTYEVKNLTGSFEAVIY